MKLYCFLFLSLCTGLLQGAPCKIYTEVNTPSAINGSLFCYGDEAKGSNVHGIELTFYMKQAPDPNGPSLMIGSPTEGKLAEFYWDGETVIPHLYGYRNHTQYHTDTFQDCDQYRILPALSALLAHDYNVTAHTWPISIVLYRLALAAENRHGTEEAAEQYLNSQHPRRQRRSLSLHHKSSDVWTKEEPKIDCHDPQSNCDPRIELEDDHRCNQHGTHLEDVDVQNGCNGMCGPGCKKCWSHICGDCCKHPGCLSHDTACTKSYLNWACVTGKGVLWHTSDDKC